MGRISLLLCWATFAASAVLSGQNKAAGNPQYDKLYATIRANDLDGLKVLLDQGAGAGMADDHGITLLMDAAETGSLDAMKLLIARGADVNAQNSFGSTALMWSAIDSKKVRLLLDHGADPNKVSRTGRTALLVAAFSSNPSAGIVRLLLARGADPKAVDQKGWTTLNAAALGNDTATIRILIDAGADVNAADLVGPNYFGSTPLMNAAQNGNLAAVKLLLAKGAKVNAVSSREKFTQVKNGRIALGGFTPLMLAAPFGPPELIQILMDAGADVNAADIRGMTPLMLAIATDRQNAAIVKMLLAHGADVKPKTVTGETALDWANKMAATPAIEALNGQKLPAKIVPIASDAPDVRTAVDRSVGLLEKSMATFFAKSGCYACHAQVVTDFAMSAARAKGVAVDEKASIARKLQTTIFLNLSGPGFMERQDLPGSPDIILFPLESLARTAYPPDRVTDYLVAQMAAMQWPEGRWHLGASSRTPIEDGDFTRTTLGIRALKTYGPPGRAPEMQARILRARQWLLHNPPLTTEDYDMRMVGVASAGSDPTTLRNLAKPIFDLERADGGWAQRGELSSDAYATGMTLWSLAEAGMLKPSDDIYRRGVNFLLSTQRADGSWYVASRALKLQPYFEGGFPYGPDQWISSMATGWATNALALALEPAPAHQVAAVHERTH